jgi:PAS domain S-box-containing protein
VRTAGAKKSVVNRAKKVIRNNHHEMEAALRDSEQRMRAIVEAAVDAIITIDQNGLIESVNTATERLFGYSAAEMIGRNIKMLMPEPYQSEHDDYLKRYIRTGQAKIIGIGREVTAMRKDGTTFAIHLAVSEVRLDGRRLFTGIIHDMSRRRNLERQVLEISESEQRRIGQDLHDGLCQYLVGIGLSVEMIAARVEETAPDQAEEIRKIGQLIRDAATQARDLSHGLNPVGIGEQGLTNALQTLTAQISELFRVNCTFRVVGHLRVTDRAVAMHIYRITQEAVSNALRHGRAEQIKVLLKSNKSYLALIIEDNGKGFSMPTQGGMGLQTMHYRARMIGGALTVESRPNDGTTIICRIPQAN